MPRFDDRFARQDRCEPPSEFPLTSPCPGIVHHLSGLSTNALAPRLVASTGGAGRCCACDCTPPDHTSLAFAAPLGFSSPSTRARAQLLGPCFKTGLTECRDHAASTLGGRRSTDVHADDARHALRKQFADDARQRSPAGAAPHEWSGHRKRSSVDRPADATRACNTTRRTSRAHGHLAHELIAVEPTGRHAPTTPRARADPRAMRAERRRRTRPVQSVCCRHVSRALALSFQSTFQLSLTVLVC